MMLWVIQMATLFVLFLLFRQFGEVYLSRGEEISKDGLSINKELPHIHVFSIAENKKRRLLELIRGPTLLSFISTDCKPCEALIEHWNDAYETYKGKINFCVVILGEEKEVNVFLRRNPIVGELLWDQNEELFNRCLVRVTPFAFSIDQNGVVKDKGLCGNREQINLLVSSILENEIDEERGKTYDRSDRSTK